MFSFIVEIIGLDKSRPFSVPGPLMSRKEIVTYGMSLSLSPRLGPTFTHTYTHHTHKHTRIIQL